MGGGYGEMGGGYGETIDAYDVDTGNRIWRSHEKIAVVKIAAIPRAERFVAIAERSILLRSLKTGKDVAPPIDLGSSDDEPRHVAVSADGRILMVGHKEACCFDSGSPYHSVT